jgi:tRNA(Ile)-lysidine synthase
LEPSPFLPPLKAAEAFLDRLLQPARLLLAVSGGSDSTGVLIAFHHALRGWNGPAVELAAVTVDHQLRAAAADEAQGVGRLCDALSIPHITQRWEGEKPATGVSAASREARYRLLVQAAEVTGATLILTGHTADDQIETVTMRAARSAADSNLGLAGMAEAVLLDRSIWLLRPFLRTRRGDIRAYLKEQDVSWIDDPSNADPHYERVRVRGGLPASVDEKTLAEVEEAGKHRIELSYAAAALARQHIRIMHGVLARLDRTALNEDPAALRHLLSTLAAILGGRSFVPAAATIDRVLAFLRAGEPGRISAGRVIFDLRREALFMHRENRDLPTLHLPPAASAVWDGRFRIVNHRARAASVGATPPDRDKALAMFKDVPASVGMRALQAMPHLEVGSLGDDPFDKADVIIRPMLAPFDRFLPQFELSLADELGILFGCDERPALPVDVYRRKS